MLVDVPFAHLLIFSYTNSDAFIFQGFHMLVGTCNCFAPQTLYTLVTVMSFLRVLATRSVLINIVSGDPSLIVLHTYYSVGCVHVPT